MVWYVRTYIVHDFRNYTIKTYFWAAIESYTYC